MTIVFTYIVYPFTVWTLSNQIYNSVSSSATGYAAITFSILFIAVGAIISFNFLLMRNTIISEFDLSCINPLSELLSYFSVVIIQICTACFKLGNNNALMIAFDIISDLVLSMNCYNLIARQPFWNTQVSSFYIRPFASVILVKILLESCPSNVTSNMIGVIGIGIAQLTFRLVPNLIHYFSKIQVFGKSIGQYQRYVGLIMLQSYIFRVNADPTEQNSDLYTYYLGIWKGYLKKLDQTEIQDKSTQRLLVEYVANLNTNKATYLRMLLMLQISDPLPWLSTLHSILSKLKSLSSNGFINGFQYFHYKRLLEIKLDALYKGKIKDDAENNSASILNLYRNTAFYLRSTSDKTEDSLDICKVFHWIKVHKNIIEMATKQLDKMGHIFNSLSTGENLSTGNLYSLNRDTMNIDRVMLKIINETTREDESLPSYLYPPIIFYLSLVRNRIRLAEKIYKNYKMKLQQLQVAYERYSSLLGSQKERSKSLVHTVSLIASLYHNRSGEIMHASLDFSSYLGFPENGEIIGRNINELLPKALAIDHRELIEEGKLEKVINKQDRTIFLTGFDGLLRQSIIDIRLHNSLSEGSQSIMLLRFPSLPDQAALLLTDSKGSIIAASSDFWEKVAASVKIDPTTIHQLSLSLQASLGLLLLAEETRAVKPERGTPEIFYAMQDSLAELCEKNQDGNMVYTVEKGSA